jgi:hypothetical protein
MEESRKEEEATYLPISGDDDVGCEFQNLFRIFGNNFFGE